MMDRRAGVNRFYEILHRNIAKRGLQELGALSSALSIFSHPELNQIGVYFIFEPNEFREDGVTPRVVYIGKTKTATLRVRLERHSRDSDESNLHGYIFEAVARAAGKGDTFKSFFGRFWRDIPDPQYTEMRAFEFGAVLPSIRRMSFTWLPVPSTDQRQRLEEGAIALLSNFPRGDVGSPIDPPSATWLRSHMSNKPHICQSGLWNNNRDVKRDIGDCAWLDEFGALVAEPI
jgi:hypothetical protein